MMVRVSRKGLTLLEVVVSVAIFLIALAAIWELFLIGGDRARDVKLQTRTSMLCQSKLAEVVVGAADLTSSSDYTNFTDEFNKDLQWRMEVESTDAENVSLVKVWVKADLPGGRIVESHLAQMVLDPKVRGSSLDRGPDPLLPATPAK